MMRNRIGFGLLFSLIIGICAAPALAQAPAALTGTVKDATQAVVAGATIVALNLATGQITTTTTDASGQYQFTRLAPGAYQLSATSAGFGSVAQNISLRAGESSSHDFTLVPGILRDTITITAGKGSPRLTEDLPQSVTVTNLTEIEQQRPAATLQASELVPNLTQVHMHPASERPRLRGLTSNRLLVIVDGDRLNNVRSDPFSGVSPSIVDTTQLESVEVISGTGSSLYGSDALAGTINLITKAPTLTMTGQYLGLRVDGDLSTNGLFRRGAAAFNWSNPKVAARLSGSLFRTDNYHSGNGSISIEEVVRLGRFATDLGNAVGNNVARTYALWALPRQVEITNGHGQGFNHQGDLWYFPSPRHNLRYRQLNSQHKKLGFPFLTPPYDQREQSNGFRRLDKYGARYEGREFTNWLARIAGSFYRQKYAFADDNFVYTINTGSSWEIIQLPGTPPQNVPRLTGRPSVFTLGNFTDGKNAVTSYGTDLQTTLVPLKNLVVTSGFSYLRDFSHDEFTQIEFTPGTTTPRRVTAGRAGNPDSLYQNLGWFNLVEYEPTGWLRLLGSLRLDNWRTEARPTAGFPVGTESAILSVSFNRLLAQPGSINVAGLAGLTELVNGTQGITTNKTTVTGQTGVIVRLPGRLRPYFRYGTGYREPGITERYSLRNFGDPTFSVLLVPNTALKPETGRNYEVGIKTQQTRWQASASYFRQNLADFIRPAFGEVMFVPADASRGLLPLSPFFPFHGILYVQRTNTARARIEGVEVTYEASLSLGRAGTLTPFGVAGWLKGSDLTPDRNALRLINQFYNRSDTPIKLTGAPDDVPLSGITPFRGIFGSRYLSPRGQWFGEYQVRAQGRITRADPLELSATISTQYGTLASLNSFAKHSLRAGYTYRQENYRLLFTVGVENLTDRLYFEHFQTAPAPGRSFVFGITTDFTKSY